MGFYGFYTCQKAGLPMRYGISMLGLSLIAVGSLGFHMTVSFEDYEEAERWKKGSPY